MNEAVRLDRSELNYFLPWCAATSTSLVDFIDGSPRIQLSWLYAGLAALAYFAGTPRGTRQDWPTQKSFHDVLQGARRWPFDYEPLVATLERLRKHKLVAEESERIVPTPYGRAFLVEQAKGLVRCFSAGELPVCDDGKWLSIYAKLFSIVVLNSYGDNWRLVRLEINRRIALKSPRTKGKRNTEYLGENPAYPLLINIVTLFGPISGEDIHNKMRVNYLTPLSGGYENVSNAILYLREKNILLVKNGQYTFDPELESDYISAYRPAIGASMAELRLACDEWINATRFK